MDLGIQNKVALVTGASKGIGLAVARGLASEGAHVVLSARGAEDLRDAVRELEQSGGAVTGIQGDVSHADGVAELLTELRQAVGDPDILVVNAGGPPTGPAAELPDEAWLQGYELTLMSAVRLARAVLPVMKERRWGRIVNITSVSVVRPIPNLTLSNSLRAAVTGYVRTLAREVASYGVTVNNVAPGYTATERLAEVFDSKEAVDAFVQRIPIKRLATPDEIAAMVTFLASVKAAYVTGQTMLVDGGYADAAV